MPKITNIKARQIIDSRGNPTVECDIEFENSTFGRALPKVEFSNSISHSTVGFPLLSIICLAFIFVILGMIFRYIIKLFKLN